MIKISHCNPIVTVIISAIFNFMRCVQNWKSCILTSIEVFIYEIIPFFHKKYIISSRI